MCPSTRLLVAAASLSTVLSAQAKWSQLKPAASPAPRAALSSAVSFTGLYVFGGGTPGGKFSDELWRFDGKAWSNLTPATGNPPGRSNHGMAFDQARNRVVLFGGQGAGAAIFGDTWEFDGVKWAKLAPATGPSPRRAVAMAYDLDRKVVVMHGGENLGNWFDETWEWSGTAWKLITTARKPSSRGRHRMVYDAFRKRMVTFGGAGPAWLVPNTDPATWTYDGVDWSPIKTANVPKGKGVTPTGLLVFGMAFDRLRDRVVLAGGYANSTYQSDTWEFDGVDWTDRGTQGGLPIRGGPAMGFVLAAGKTAIFGGFNGTSKHRNDTWDYQTDAWPDFKLAGAACKGSSGTPVIAAATRPWLGTAFEVSVAPVPAANPVLMLIGGRRTALPLAAVGAPGCTAYVSLDVVLPATTRGANATLGISLPASAVLIGQQFYLQGAVRDAAANRLGFAFTARGEVRLGAL